jgi:hypothetical protein
LCLAKLFLSEGDDEGEEWNTAGRMEENKGSNVCIINEETSRTEADCYSEFMEFICTFIFNL